MRLALEALGHVHEGSEAQGAAAVDVELLNDVLCVGRGQVTPRRAVDGKQHQEGHQLLRLEQSVGVRVEGREGVAQEAIDAEPREGLPKRAIDLGTHRHLPAESCAGVAAREHLSPDAAHPRPRALGDGPRGLDVGEEALQDSDEAIVAGAIEEATDGERPLRPQNAAQSRVLSAAAPFGRAGCEPIYERIGTHQGAIVNDHTVREGGCHEQLLGVLASHTDRAKHAYEALCRDRPVALLEPSQLALHRLGPVSLVAPHRAHARRTALNKDCDTSDTAAGHLRRAS
mmetsp:Transcript_133151/g.385201  ORF Transcript_133151/g.385201 Transcript_133151/m.385201 type:complete len:286 (+) Transcript_133151:1497-2354(+)